MMSKSPVDPGTFLFRMYSGQVCRHRFYSAFTGLAQRLKERSFKVTTQVRTGQQVAVEVIDYARETEAELIVMCTHGRSGITRWLLGSVALKVLTGGETPILLIRSKE